VISGPKGVTIEAPSDPKSAIRFAEPGQYVLRLTATAAGLTDYDDVLMTVVKP
jgi:hypothetical protein